MAKSCILNISQLFIVLPIIIFSQACGQKTNQSQKTIQEKVSVYNQEPIRENLNMINQDGLTTETRFLPPDGYGRTKETENSFATYLRQLPLKPDGSEVRYHNGNTKPNRNIYTAVVDMDIGKKDLHQCADAVMRLYAEYLFDQKQYDKIHFNFTNGFRVDYTEWMKGKRIVVNGNKSYWAEANSSSNTYKDFWDYMEVVFTYAGTLSLSKELESVDFDDLKIGDIFIQGGSPGHAVIVIDIASKPSTKEKVFLLAQSYMPVQEIQILANPGNRKISPWYSASFGEILKTPEWTFKKGDLKRFGE